MCSRVWYIYSQVSRFTFVKMHYKYFLFLCIHIYISYKIYMLDMTPTATPCSMLFAYLCYIWLQIIHATSGCVLYHYVLLLLLNAYINKYEIYSLRKAKHEFGKDETTLSQFELLHCGWEGMDYSLLTSILNT